MLVEMSKLRKLAVAANMLCLYYLAYKSLTNRKKQRKWWVRPTYQQRRKFGFFEKTFLYIKEHDQELFFKHTRMNRIQYDILLQLIADKLKKTSIRKPISPECRLAVTLMYLSQGVSINYLAVTFRMGASTVRNIILEVCDSLWNVLSPIYMSPLNTSDLLMISDDFNSEWQMPNCIGSIDGKHIKIRCPPNSGSKYFNFKGEFSIVLMAACDANYTFTAVDVGAYGSQSDGGVFRNSRFGQRVIYNDINAPSPRKLPDSDKETPMYFVADSAFPLRTNLMRPYPGLLLDQRKGIFNQRLSRARRVIENTFGILVARWRILLSRIEFTPKNADKVVLACVILHNFLKKTDCLQNEYTYNPPGYTDRYDDAENLVLGRWREENANLSSVTTLGCSNNSVRQAQLVRETLADYFLT